MQHPTPDEATRAPARDDDRLPYVTPELTTIEGELSVLLGTASACESPGADLA